METFVSLWENPWFSKVVTATIGLLVLGFVMRVVTRWGGRRISDNQLRYRFRKVLTLLRYVGFLIVLAMVFRKELGGVGVALGVAGAGVAFALQEVIASFAGWIAISIGGFYSIGDRVQLGGVKGDVIDIGIIRTTVMEIGQWVDGDLYNGRIVRIANSFVFKEPVFNYSGHFPFVWDEIRVPVKYGSDHKEARAILARVADEVVGDYAAGARQAWGEVVERFMIENAQVDPMITMIANDNWIEFTLRYVVDVKRRRGTKDKLFTGILDEVDASGGRVAMASATFHLVETPVFDVRLHPASGALPPASPAPPAA